MRSDSGGGTAADIVTLLFTDLVGSTELLQRMGDDAAEEFRRLHFRLLRQVVAARGGEEVKNLGDGLMVVFGSALDALGSAIDIQRAVRAHNERGRGPAFQIRVGLNAGLPIRSEDDYFGTSVVVAKRLCDAAEGEQILVSEVLAGLVGSRGGFAFEPVGSLDLKGLAQPVAAMSLEWREPASESPPLLADVDVPLPLALRCPEPFRFVERPEPWGVLDRAWAGAAAGARQIVLVAGEAGAGKTRLVTEFARQRHAEGAFVLHGGCSDPPSIPYQPFAEAVDQLLATLDALGRADLVADEAEQLSRLVPRLAGTTPDEGSAPGDPDAERYRLFAAVSTALGALAAHRPLLLILEDLHWAARPTVQLLEHLVRGPATAAPCILVTFRSTPADVGDAFKAALPALRRSPGVSRIVLPGFDRDGIRRFVEVAAGHPVHLGLERVVDILADQTEGNPFLLGELWQHLIEAGELVRPHGPWRLARPIAEVASPEGVREVVEARLAMLPDGTRHVLAAAAVLGAAFEFAVLSVAADRDGVQLLDALEPALQAGLVEEAGPGAGRFHHALVRRSVYDHLSLAERRARHRDAARALYEVMGDRAVGDIAHHLTAAVPLVEVDVVVAVARRAAAAAMRAVAYDDAARHLDAVLPLVPPDRGRCELLLEDATAHMRAGDADTAQAYCLEASELARRLGEPALVVASALAYDEANWRAAGYGLAAEQLLRAALPLAADDIERARLQAALAHALAFSGQGDKAAALGAEVLAEARRLGDQSTLRTAFLAVQFAPWTPSTLERQVATAREFAALGQAHHDLECEVAALNRLLYGLIFAGELGEAREVAARHHDGVRRLAQPLFRVLDLQAHALLAVGEGRFALAEAMAEEADELTRFLSGTDMSGAYGVQLFSLRRLQGRLEEARPTVEAVARMGEEGATWRPALAVLHAELGELDAAAADLRHLVGDGLAAVPRDSLWWGTLSYLADTCAAVGDREAAVALHAEFLPCRGLVVQVGSFLAAYGAADRYLGMLAALLGRRDDAEAHFQAALALETRAEMPVWLAQTRLAYGRFLAEGSAPADVGHAQEVLNQARDEAQRLGMLTVARQAAEALNGSGREPVPSAVSTGIGGETLTGREVAVLRLIVEGCSNREIAARLYISPHTAGNHVRAILVKTGCANRTEAAAWALRHGID
jgi:class 3 adenylate cyclase/DNA-binding CsgD family transcriptional regulator/tetratricopeptide (TPR) repeat protein